MRINFVEPVLGNPEQEKITCLQQVIFLFPKPFESKLPTLYGIKKTETFVSVFLWAMRDSNLNANALYNGAFLNQFLQFLDIASVGKLSSNLYGKFNELLVFIQIT